MIFRKTKYLKWKDYKNYVDVLDVILWQQRVRSEALKA